ncbi:MAG: DUF1559 family PulG-like putative transporter [Isosphaeraceae bacterium]
MGRWTIRRTMILIAAVAGLLGGYRFLGSVFDVREQSCGPNYQCASCQRNLVLGILQCANETGSFPRGTWPNADLRPDDRLSFYFATLPYLENEDLAKSIDSAAGWKAPQNRPAATQRIAVMRCPEAPSQIPGGYSFTPHIGIAGLGVDAPILPKGHPRAGVFGYDRQTTLKDITDGTFCTMVLAESSRSYGSWLTGGHATVRGLDPSDQPYLGTDRQYGGLHFSRYSNGGGNVAFADGSVRFISETVDPRIFEALSTIAGGENLPPEAFSPQ